MRRKILWTLPVIVLAIVLSGAIKTYAGMSESGRGWLWGGSESPSDRVSNGNETSVGWLSVNNVDEEGNYIDPSATVSYGVNIPSSNGSVTGYAWSENYGWISFEAEDLTGCPQSAATRLGTTLIGGARVLSIRDAGANSGGWKGCISLSGVSTDNTPYGVTIASDGRLGGYAWNGEKDLGSGLIEGLGWIDFSKAFLAKVLKICPSQATISQGSIQKFWLYNDARPDCGSGAEFAVPADSWVKKDPQNVIQEMTPENNNKSVKIKAVFDAKTFDRKAILEATYQGKKVTAEITVLAMLPACSCDAAIAAKKCNTVTFPGTVGQPCLETICNGTRDCSANWKEVPPMN